MTYTVSKWVARVWTQVPPTPKSMLFPNNGADGEPPECSKPESRSDSCQAAPTIRVHSPALPYPPPQVLVWDLALGGKGEGSYSVDPSFSRPSASSEVEIHLRTAMIPQSDSVTKATRFHREESRGIEEK